MYINHRKISDWNLALGVVIFKVVKGWFGYDGLM